jgi:hypothetical protein
MLDPENGGSTGLHDVTYHKIIFFKRSFNCNWEFRGVFKGILLVVERTII